MQTGSNDPNFTNMRNYTFRFSSVVHGAHVTAYGRLKLLSLLQAVPEGQLLYCDTDSVQFLLHESQENPFNDQLTGNLGQLTDEVNTQKSL